MIRIGQAMGVGPNPQEMARLAALEAWRRTDHAPPFGALVFTTKNYPLESVYAGIFEALGGINVVGCHCPGLMACGLLTYDGVGVLVFAGDEGSMHVGLGRKVSEDPQRAGADAVVGAMQGMMDTWGGQPSREESFLMVLSDATPGQSEEILRGVNREVGTSIPVMGGSFGLYMESDASSLLLQNHSLHDAVLAIAVTTPTPTGSALRHGYVPMEQPLQATRTQKFQLGELDWEAAGPQYKSLVERIHTTPIARENILELGACFPLGIPGHNNDYLLRCPIDWDQQDQLLCTAEIPPLSPVQVMMGKPMQLLQAAFQAGKQAASVVHHYPLAAVLVFTCITRGAILGHKPNDRNAELRAIHQGIASISPIFGCLTSAQFGSLGGGLPQVHTQAIQVGILSQSTPSSSAYLSA